MHYNRGKIRLKKDYKINMVKKNSIKAWFLASRPKTLTGAMAPVLIGGGMAWHDTIAREMEHAQQVFVNYEDSSVYWNSHYIMFFIPFALCMLFAFLMQIDANFVNDWWDFKKGTDREDRLGPERACAQGWISSKAMMAGIVITTVLACMVGMLLMMWFMQWELLLVGVACVLGCFLYTLKLSYLGLGDLLVILFFGIVPVGFTYYVITNGMWTWNVTMAGLGMGLITDNLLIVNNYRDVEQDKLSGKKTLVVRFGTKFAENLYLINGFVSAVLMGFVNHKSVYPGFFVFIVFATFFLYKEMCSLTGKSLNKILGKTALLIFVYGLFCAILALM